MTSLNQALPSRLHRLLNRMVAVEAHEVQATLLGFAWFCCLLSGYYLLRPLRDALGVVGGPEELRWLFTATFAAMLALVPVFGWLVTKFSPRRFVPWVYRFFALTLLAFGALLALHLESAWLARCFFVWVSVFNLFVVSIFWSVLDDCFSSAQGRRLFGFIAAGGTLGTVLGPLLAAAASTLFDPMVLALAAALLLELALRCFRGIYPHHEAGPVVPAHSRPLRGQVWAGLSLIARSPYLLGICAYLLLHTAASTFLYFEQARIVADALPDTASRTRWFAAVDLGVSCLALALQVLVTGRLMRRFGLVLCLALLPWSASRPLARWRWRRPCWCWRVSKCCGGRWTTPWPGLRARCCSPSCAARRNTRPRMPSRRWCTAAAMP
ncbi:NTP/NDP exchange transporter [Comamonas endophytica]|uniref:NTP/NDP exchange transporter n=1 Tax=Comamonas endophytica TaxID=2949090 RepID=UPI003607EDA1